MSQAAISAVRVEGDNRPGLGHAIAKALAAGINMDFFLAHVSGRRHITVIGFDSREDIGLRAGGPSG